MNQPIAARVLAMEKKKGVCVKSSPTEPEFYLPDDCWEHVFSFIINPVDQNEYNDKLNFESISLVSKQFLSVINRLIFSMIIYFPRLRFLPHFFRRFPNLNSLDIQIHPKSENFIISLFIHSFVGLKGFNLNSLKSRCSRISDDLLYAIAREGLPLKTFALESCIGYSYHGIYDLLSKCHGIQHLVLEGVDFLNNHHVSQLSLLLPHLRTINLSWCSNLTQSALLALIQNCHSLHEITMENLNNIPRERVEKSDHTLKDFHVNPQFKFLSLFNSSIINDDTLILFASIFPNLQHLDLSFCHHISKKGISQVFNTCCMLRYLKLISCTKVKGLKLNFVVPHLEELILSHTDVDDKTLYEISMKCCGLLQLQLINCEYVTEKGVEYVVENCTQCRVIK